MITYFYVKELETENIMEVLTTKGIWKRFTEVVYDEVYKLPNYNNAKIVFISNDNVTPPFIRINGIQLDVLESLGVVFKPCTTFKKDTKTTSPINYVGRFKHFKYSSYINDALNKNHPEPQSYKIPWSPIIGIDHDSVIASRFPSADKLIPIDLTISTSSTPNDKTIIVDSIGNLLQSINTDKSQSDEHISPEIKNQKHLISNRVFLRTLVYEKTKKRKELLWIPVILEIKYDENCDDFDIFVTPESKCKLNDNTIEHTLQWITRDHISDLKSIIFSMIKLQWILVQNPYNCDDFMILEHNIDILYDELHIDYNIKESLCEFNDKYINNWEVL